jgi:hypothetical protein
LKNKEIKGVKMKLSEKDEFARDIVSEKEMVSATISICSDYGKRYEFKKPSFTYDYLYINDDGYVYGRVYNDIQKVWKEKKWNKETGKVYGSGDATYFNLVPVKQESDVDDIDVVNISESPKVCDGMWNGYYIEAIQEAYDLLVSDGYIPKYGTIEYKIIVIRDNLFTGTNHLNGDYKPLYIVDGKLSETPTSVGKEDFTVTEVKDNKYDRLISGKHNNSCVVDVYDVLKAFEVTNPALQHLIKKALCVGIRGHKDASEDLQDIIDSAVRAKELEK